MTATYSGRAIIPINFDGERSPVLYLTSYRLLDAGKLARSQYPEGPVTGHLDTGFSWFPWVLQQMLRLFSTVPSCHCMLHM